jgi:hypothetical protein
MGCDLRSPPNQILPITRAGMVSASNNPSFTTWWKKKTGNNIIVQSFNFGSSLKMTLSQIYLHRVLFHDRALA